MSSYVSTALRRLVDARADALCEYCLVHEDDTVFGCEVDHIISEKHGGATEAENLAYACAFCNRAKGSDIGSIVQGTGTYVRFFHPRIDRWAEHFTLDGVKRGCVFPIRSPSVFFAGRLQTRPRQALCFGVGEMAVNRYDRRPFLPSLAQGLRHRVLLSASRCSPGAHGQHACGPGLVHILVPPIRHCRQPRRL